jgi:tetratricopeptide (TPR) repeat protein
MHLAGLYLRLDDTAGYRRTCAAMLARFGRTRAGLDANNTAWTCALAPAALDDLEPLLRLAEHAVTAEQHNADHRNTLGAVLYRMGRYESARECLQEAIHQREGGGAAEDWFLLALTHHELGDDAEAQHAFSQAIRWLEAAPPGQLPGTTHRSVMQRRRTELFLLRREAEAALAQR